MSTDKKEPEQSGANTAQLHQKLNLNPADSELLTHPSYEELQKKLDEAEEKASQNWDQVLRMQAEMVNVRKRMDKEIESAHKYGLDRFVDGLLPVIDGFERSLTSHPEKNSILEGVELTLKMFYGVLEKPFVN